VVLRSRSAWRGADVAARVGISPMAAARSLRRLRDAGAIVSSVSLVDTPSRLRNSVTMYQRAGLRGLWPEWLCPYRLPAISARHVFAREW
jgi:DNA-binding MarR family transcriptional regulator